MESKVSGHWTDEQLVAHLYGVEGGEGHFESCPECRARLSQLQANRAGTEAGFEDAVSFDFLAAQRRKIYARLTERGSWWSRVQIRRWASAAATVLVLGGGLLVYEERREQAAHNRLSDAQLAQQVSSMAQDSEPQPTAPLQALFEE